MGFALLWDLALVVLKENTTSDVIFSSSSAKKLGNSLLQYFWEAFPAGYGPTDRTTYLFTYVAVQPGAPKLEELLEDFWDILPNYQPNLRASWLFQRALSARPNSGVSSTFINKLLYFNFQSMQSLGDPVLRPFLQDVIQFGPLVKTLGSVMLNHPGILPSIFKQVGIPVILDWLVHFVMLGWYTLLTSYFDPVIRSWIDFLPQKKKYELSRTLEAWKYGSGLDYKPFG